MTGLSATNEEDVWTGGRADDDDGGARFVTISGIA